MTRSPRFRTLALLLAGAVALSACAGAGAYDPGLTPQQRAMREQANRWNATAATGAAAGAALGAAAGLAAGGRNRGEAALAGALLGGVLGLMAGAAIADRNLAFEQRELPLQDRIADAQQRTAQLEQFTASAEQVSLANRRRLDELDFAWRRGQISAAQYRAEAEKMRADVELMRGELANARSFEERLHASGKDSAALTGQANRAANARARLERTTSDLESRLARVPAA